jgi:hypothetical protein
LGWVYVGYLLRIVGYHGWFVIWLLVGLVTVGCRSLRFFGWLLVCFFFRSFVGLVYVYLVAPHLPHTHTITFTFGCCLVGFWLVATGFSWLLVRLRLVVRWFAAFAVWFCLVAVCCCYVHIWFILPFWFCGSLRFGFAVTRRV